MRMFKLSLSTDLLVLTAQEQGLRKKLAIVLFMIYKGAEQ